MQFLACASPPSHPTLHCGSPSWMGDSTNAANVDVSFARKRKHPLMRSNYQPYCISWQRRSRARRQLTATRASSKSSRNSSISMPHLPCSATSRGRFLTLCSSFSPSEDVPEDFTFSSQDHGRLPAVHVSKHSSVCAMCVCCGVCVVVCAVWCVC